MKQTPLDIFGKFMLEEKATNIIEHIREAGTDSYENILEKSGGKNLDPLNKKRITKKVIIPKKDVQIEWWYFTGHLSTEEREYGFEWCMFKIHPRAVRFGFIPLSLFRKSPFLVLHTAITDKTGNKFYHKQDSGAVHPSHINYEKLKVELNGSSIKYTDEFDLKSEQMDLVISPTKKLVKQHDDGYGVMDRKSKSTTYYVTYPRSDVKGKIRVGKDEIKVSGECWFDHQKCVIPQRANLLGWDWFSIMFDDNTELMLITMRDKRGLRKRDRVGTYVKKNGDTINLTKEDFEVESTKEWKSKRTGITYPAKWSVILPKLKLEFTVTPYVQDQEINSSLSTPICYWEGACKVEGTRKDKPIAGKSYVELVGYDDRLATKLLRSQAS